jgi:hypothetical protein
MIADNRTGEYIKRMIEAIEAGQVMAPTVCPECEHVMNLDTECGHVVYRLPDTAMVCIIGCEGYWCINPASVGLPIGNWQAGL